MPQNDLVRYLQSARFAILPSLSEQWGVALHEYVVAGLPVLVSDSVGAKSSFLINGFNGFSFESTSVEDLLRVMLHVSEFDNDRVKQFSENSLMLGCRISPASSAYNFISVLD